MAQCPKCQADLTEDFGLIECPQCQARLLIQLDGSVQSVTETPEPENCPAEAGGEANEDFESALMSALESAAEPERAAEPDHTMVIDSAVELDPTFVIAPATAAEVDAFFDDEIQAPALPPPEPALHDLSQLANTTESSGTSGSLRYSVTISGIDTADVRNQFRDLISDRKFLWDTDRIIKSIKSGRVRLDDVTAVKAVILIQQLRSLPVQVKWEQHVVHQS